jgi:hypothetical protein
MIVNRKVNHNKEPKNKLPASISSSQNFQKKIAQNYKENLHFNNTPAHAKQREPKLHININPEPISLKSSCLSGFITQKYPHLEKDSRAGSLLRQE